MLSADLEGTAIEGLGVRRSVTEGLALKSLFYLGEATIQELADGLCIAPFIVEGIFQRLKKDQLMQAVGLSPSGHHRVNLTGAGRARAAELLSVDQYVGAVPVSLAAYIERVKSQSIRDISVTPADVKDAFKEMVLDESMLAQLGTSVISGRAIFLYGPPGTGKTTVAEHLSEIFRKESVWVPHAIEVDGQIISVFDDHVHERVEGGGGMAGDNRWVRCRRPVVMVGGELNLQSSNSNTTRSRKFYEAPIQMKANNGVFILDDFGRQCFTARTAQPLDRAAGTPHRLPQPAYRPEDRDPVRPASVFCTNLRPGELVDEAFLRRIQTKINLGKVTREQFHEIFKRACTAANVKYDMGLVDDVMKRIEHEFEQPIRACHPRDLVNQITWRAKYEQKPAALSLESLHEACRAYFLTRSEP